MSTTVYLNLGTNSGDRREFLSRAVAALASHPFFAGARCLQSSVVESEPWGYESTATYLNLGVAFVFDTRRSWTPESLETLLDITQGVERSLSQTPHRNADGTYRDREIDIDIIEVDNITYSSERLTLPHPRAHLRPFVSGPLAELKKMVEHNSDILN